MKYIDNICNLVLANTTNEFDNYFIKVEEVEYFDNKMDYNNLFYYGLKENKYFDNIIKSNNIHNKTIYHLVCIMSNDDNNVLDLLSNIENSKINYNVDFNKNEYLNKLSKHIDDFKSLINKYNLPDNLENIVSNHYNILNNLYLNQIKYNKENENLLLKKSDCKLIKRKKNISNCDNFISITGDFVIILIFLLYVILFGILR
tara:strand:- start:9 stop:614 length:606 start_codon:yes stop_codon:yes gene_type:complete